jgi:hypothetical protein
MTETASAPLPALGICLEGYEYRSWTLSNSEHYPVGGPERSWVTWSGGMAREGVAVFRHVRGCRESWRGPPSLVTCPARGRSGVALTARSSGRARVTPAHLHAYALSACYQRIAPEIAIVCEESLSAGRETLAAMVSC